VLALVVGGAMRLVMGGLVVGLAAAAAASQVLQAQLHDVGPRDPVVYAGVAVAFSLVGVIAAAVPARRASRVDPCVSLTRT
jgi:putative ABC transport system permease protein